MKPALPRISEEAHRVGAKLSVDALALFVVFGVGYLLSEFILPGIFSTRVNFFLFFLMLATLMLLGILAFRALRKESTESITRPVLSKQARVGFALFATIFLFWAEKKIPLTILIPLAIVTFLVLLSFFNDFFGRSDVNKKTDGTFGI